MIRVIGGTARGRLLKTPEGLSTRPTGVRARQFLFDVLAPQVRESRFLDIFAGSGAMGIEALSRGAAFAAFVESDPKALDTLRQNLKVTGFASQTVVAARPWPAALGAIPGEYNLIFLDPPYGKGLVLPTLESLERSTLLAPDAVVIDQCSPDEAPPPVVGGLTRYRENRIGQSLVFLYRRDQRERGLPPQEERQ